MIRTKVWVSPLAILTMAIAISSCKEVKADTEAKSIAVTPDTITSENLIISKDSDTLLYRNQNWNPQKGKYYFSEAFYFAYDQQTMESGSKGSTGEFGFYVDPESGTLLLEKRLSNFSDEMTQYVIVKPDNTYILVYTDEFGKQKMLQKKLMEVEGMAQDLSYAEQEFHKSFEPKQQFQSFGANPYYAKSLNAQRYERKYVKSMDNVNVYLAKTKFPTTALYLTGTVFKELGWPMQWDYGYVLPDHTLVVEEKFTVHPEKSIGFRLKAIMATEYHIQLPENL